MLKVVIVVDKCLIPEFPNQLWLSGRLKMELLFGYLWRIELGFGLLLELFSSAQGCLIQRDLLGPFLILVGFV